MHSSITKKITVLLVVAAAANGRIKVLHTNDDGWAVANIRAQNTDLRRVPEFNVVMSAPAENESGTGSSDAPATPLGPAGCEFMSCPANASATGFDPNDRRLNYVNSFPVTAVRFGIQTAAPPFFGGTKPDFVVSGPNVGNNLGSVVLESGTVGAACEAAKEGVPSVAFSGGGGAQISFTTLSTPSNSTTTALVFAELGTTFTKTILALPFSKRNPILPANITINVNYPQATGECTVASKFKFIFTRINNATDDTPPDVNICGSSRLPQETGVVDTAGQCLASVSVMNATTKGDVDAATQRFVLNRIRPIISCL